MANNLAGRPWVIDTSSTTVPVKRGVTFTTGFVFENYTNNGASLATIKDGKRNVTVCSIPGVTGNTPVSEAWFVPQAIDDMIISFDSGDVRVIVR